MRSHSDARAPEGRPEASSLATEQQTKPHRSMRVLILTQFYWPEQRSAPNNLAAIAHYLQTRGHDVVVVTGFPNHPLGRIYAGYSMRWRQWDEVQGVPVLRLPLFPDHSLSAIRRGWHYLSFALVAATLGAWLTRRFAFDVLLVYLPPLTNWLPASVLARLHGARLVYWESDLWPEALLATGARLPGSIRRLIERLDRRAHAKTFKICLNSAGHARRLQAKGVESSRIAIVGDWADETLFFPVEADRQLAEMHGLDGKFNIVYGGSFGPAQDLRTVLEAAALLNGIPNVQLVLIGDGEEEPSLRAFVHERSLDNVRILSRQPMDQMRHFFAIADVLLAHLSPAPHFDLQIPSKLMAYMACSRPILCAIRGCAAEIVRDADAGFCCEPGDPSAIADATRELYRMPASRRTRMGNNGRETYLRRYTLEAQASTMEAVLLDASSHRSSTNTSKPK